MEVGRPGEFRKTQEMYCTLSILTPNENLDLFNQAITTYNQDLANLELVKGTVIEKNRLGL